MTIPRIALIPAYEPDEALLKLLPQVQAAGFEIIIIDDGSGAEYAPLFEKAKSYAVILTHEINCGKGSALKTGFSYIYLHYKKPCTIVTIDADGQHDINDALAICAIAEAHPDTLVLGSRKLNGRVPVRSQFGNALTRMVYHLATGLKVQDTQTGLRAFSLEHLPLLMDIPGERYEYEMNVLLEYARKKIPIQEHEIETIYTLGYVPEGYEYDIFYSNEVATKITWINENNQIVFCQYVLDGRTALDNENTNYQYIYVDDIKVVVTEKNGKRSLFWNTDEYAFSLDINVDVSEEEWITIIKSIVEKE